MVTAELMPPLSWPRRYSTSGFFVCPSNVLRNELFGVAVQLFKCDEFIALDLGAKVVAFVLLH